MIGGGPDPAHVVRVTRERCHVALMGNHDYAATGSVEPSAARGPGRRPRSSSPARTWPRTTSRGCARAAPAARREGVQCWHGGPRNPVWEFVGPSNAAACLAVQKADLGLVAHTHTAAAFTPTRRVNQDPRRRTAGPVRRQMAAEPGRGRRAGTAPSRLVRRARRGSRRRRVLARARPAPPHRDLAPRALRPAPARGRARALGLDDA